jgi:hypothetical protein
MAHSLNEYLVNINTGALASEQRATPPETSPPETTPPETTCWVEVYDRDPFMHTNAKRIKSGYISEADNSWVAVARVQDLTTRPLGGNGTGRPGSKVSGAQADEEVVVVECGSGGSERDEEESVDSEDFHVRLSGYSTKPWLYHNQSRQLLSECCRKASCRNDKLPRLAVEVAAGVWVEVCNGGWVRGFGVVVCACFVVRLLRTHTSVLIRI